MVWVLTQEWDGKKSDSGFSVLGVYREKQDAIDALKEVYSDLVKAYKETHDENEFVVKCKETFAKVCTNDYDEIDELNIVGRELY